GTSTKVGRRRLAEKSPARDTDRETPPRARQQQHKPRRSVLGWQRGGSESGPVYPARDAATKAHPPLPAGARAESTWTTPERACSTTGTKRPWRVPPRARAGRRASVRLRS